MPRVILKSHIPLSGLTHFLLRISDRIMPKLLKLKKWLTIPEAARHLSAVVDETVAESDIYQYALDGILKLSINFITPAYAKPGKIASMPESKDRSLYFYNNDSTEIFAYECDERLDFRYKGITIEDGFEFKLMQLPKDFPHDEGALKSFEPEDEIIKLSGIHDIPLIGNEKELIGERLVKLKSGNDTDQSISFNICGLLVSKEGEFYQIQKMLSSNQLQQLEDNTETSIELHKRFIPSANFPSDSLIVICTNEISKFISYALEENTAPKPLSTKEKNSLAIIIKSLSCLAKIDIDHPSKAATAIQKQAELLGLTISQNTIQKFLTDTKERTL